MVKTDWYGTRKVPSGYIQCIVCGENVSRKSKKRYQPLGHFPDHCYCTKCLKAEDLPGKMQPDYGR